ncbi:MAG: Uncharacterized protein G01um101416_34 [Microgenomates group bacterium Gr01-1014_16]|nr:MAG: Uncharacterized protein G01um101416_34 [Microgenomates group bacterium Gr01-1014_16]
MIDTLLFDFSKVILFLKDPNYSGTLNGLYRESLSSGKPFSFWDYFELNSELVDYLKILKDKFSLYLFTSGTIQEAPELKKTVDELFTKIYSAEKMGYSKTDPEAYKFITSDLNRIPSEIAYIDDQWENIQTAQSFGIRGIQYHDNPQLFSELSQL